MKSLLLTLAFAEILAGQTPLPDATELIHKAIAAAKAQTDKGWQYTSREDSDEWDIDSNGKRTHQTRSTFEHIMLEGGDYKKLILLNGKPLDRKTQTKVGQDEERERAIRRLHPNPPGFHYSGSLDQLERLFNSRVTDEETLGNRKTWRMEAEPKPDYKPANDAEQQLLAMRHIFWFDQQDGMEVKETGVALKSSNGLPPGSTIEILFAKFAVAGSHAWLIESVTFETKSNGSHSRSYGYKRFTVDSVLKSSPAKD